MSETVFYQKHMTHHILPDWDMNWVQDVTNIFLIRHPARVIASYAKKREGPSLDDLGFAQQVRIFNAVEAPIVIDSADIRADPEGMLRKLCTRIGIAWDAGMLNWPAGGHVSDGIWAAHWYGAVHGSTGFDTAEGDLPDLTGNYKTLVEAAMPYFDALAAHKVT
jgi:hypothetical protein